MSASSPGQPCQYSLSRALRLLVSQLQWIHMVRHRLSWGSQPRLYQGMGEELSITGRPAFSLAWGGKGQQHGAGWKGSQRQSAILMPNFCNQFVVNPAAAISGPSRNANCKKTIQHSRKIYQYKTQQHGVVVLQCSTQNQVLQKNPDCYSLMLKAVQALNTDPNFI